jgi:hypothetical protein
MIGGGRATRRRFADFVNDAMEISAFFGLSAETADAPFRLRRGFDV